MPTRPTFRRQPVFAALLALAAVLASPLAASAAPTAATSALATVSAAPASPVAGCILPDAGTMGRVDTDTFRRAVGSLHAVMLFVDFPDAPASGPADRILEDVFQPAASAWLAQSSFGRLHLDVTPLRHWLRMPEPLSAFPLEHGALVGDVAKRYIREAIALADPEVDFSQAQIVYIVPNREATAYPRGNERIYDPQDGFLADGHVIRSVVTFGSTVYQRGFRVLDHETSHAFGLHDYYAASGALLRYTGDWSIMADSLLGADHFAWDKWRIGWLADSQVRCLNAPTRTDVVLSPLETAGGVKAVVLRTGLRTAIVAEYRTRQGLDTGICATGVLIYKVDSGRDGGLGPVQVSDARPHSARASGTCSNELDDAPYRPGGRWSNSTAGLEIDVTYAGRAARIRVIRTKAFVPPTPHAASLMATSAADPAGVPTLTATLAPADGFTGCAVGRLVSLQELRAGEWWTLRTAPTDASGTWSASWTPDPAATYRLLAPQRATVTDDCSRTTSATWTGADPATGG